MSHAHTHTLNTPTHTHKRDTLCGLVHDGLMWSSGGGWGYSGVGQESPTRHHRQVQFFANGSWGLSRNTLHKSENLQWQAKKEASWWHGKLLCETICLCARTFWWASNSTPDTRHPNTDTHTNTHIPHTVANPGSVVWVDVCGRRKSLYWLEAEKSLPIVNIFICSKCLRLF